MADLSLCKTSSDDGAATKFAFFTSMNESRSLFPCKVFSGEHKNSVAFLDA